MNRDFLPGREVALLAVVLVFAAALVAYLRLDPSIGDHELTIGSIAVPGRDAGDVVSILTATDGATLGRYDSMDSPRGTSYVVPGGRTLRLSGLVVSSSASALTIYVGHGATHVEDSVAAPTDALVVYSVTLPPSSEIQTLDLAHEIPSGRIPFVRIAGSGTWPSAANLVGLLTGGE